MYVSPALRMSTPKAQALIEAHPFGVLVGDDLQATHLPLQLRRDEGEFGTLYGHFARANPHWQALESRRVLAIFTGPHAYVSPTWYATRPAVPTWNYAAVHAEGRFERLDGAATAALIERSLAHFEPGLLNDKVTLDDAFRDRLLAGIVGFRLPIASLQGKAKLGQQRSAADQAGVAAGLRDSAAPEARALWRYMQDQAGGTGAP
ncbi:FMN-binding negative transcriptional regulator [Halomonas sp. I5-271120]|uniref:FMN-binding negative transcriptional regulator n=1 Tax=Halomonas sp. I5-271120 TaxID=3061632 RepID=UPI002714F2D5|nr:FMN-binding negative transcriptional regulator [Halomonas sp. I5-271120]